MRKQYHKILLKLETLTKKLFSTKTEHRKALRKILGSIFGGSVVAASKEDIPRNIVPHDHGVYETSTLRFIKEMVEMYQFNDFPVSSR